MLTITLVTAGCAGPTSQPGPGEVWRSGTILQIGLPAMLTRPIDEDCRRGYAADELELQPFALVQYFSGKAVHLRTVPVPVGSSAKVGDAVLMSPSRCRAFALR